MSARFYFTTCRAGSEATLKRDVARRHGGKLTPAFMKPQFITWKEVGEVQARDRLSLFARVSGVSLGLCKTVAEAVEHARKISGRPLCLHVFPRVTPEDGVSAEEWRRMDELDAEIRRADIDFVKVPTPGNMVLDVVVGETDAEPLFLGMHEHRAGCHVQPGGLPRLTVSDEVPSRAWLKLEQALAWRGWDTADWRAQTTLDLGCAPGGATYSLLSRGMNVIGVDTGEMDERVYQVADARGVSFEHWRVPAGKIDLGSLPSRLDLLVCDINLAPHQVLPMVERVQRHSPAKRLIVTLKLNTPELEDRAEEFLKAVRRFAPGPVHATQLAGNRREICVTASAE